MRIIINKEFGEITLVKSKKAKNFRITIKPFYGIRMTVPYFASYRSAEKVLVNKREWIRKSLLKIKEIENNYTIFDYDTNFSTKHHKLKIKQSLKFQPTVRNSNGFINVSVPVNKDIRSKEIQQLIRKGIERAWRKEAELYLPIRVKELAEEYNFFYDKVIVRNSKSRWGSCSGKNSIALSLFLMRLPDYLVDYVILHELCHTVHKNHGKKFWDLLEHVSQNAKNRAKELNNFRAHIY